LIQLQFFQGKSYMFYSCYIVVSGENQFFFSPKRVAYKLDNTLYQSEPPKAMSCHLADHHAHVFLDIESWNFGYGERSHAQTRTLRAGAIFTFHFSRSFSLNPSTWG
jgi:hypothetical protein